MLNKQEYIKFDISEYKKRIKTIDEEIEKANIRKEKIKKKLDRLERRLKEVS